ATHAVTEEDQGGSRVLPADQTAELVEVAQELVVAADEGAPAGRSAVTTVVEGVHRAAGGHERRRDVRVPSGVLTEAVDQEHDRSGGAVGEPRLVEDRLAVERAKRALGVFHGRDAIRSSRPGR